MLILYKAQCNGHHTITDLIEVISREHKIPKSTIRSNAKKLKKLGLLSYGTIEDRGIPVRLTNSGDDIIRVLNALR